MFPRFLPILRVLLLALALGSWAIPTAWAGADHTIAFEEALAQASERQVPVVVDFFTDWCVFCKHFDRDLERADSGIAAALEAVVFLSIDAEKGEGVALAKRFAVTGFPTYVVVDAQGELIDRWSGYGGPAHFLRALEGALADPAPLAVKRQRFEEHPTAEWASKFATLAAGEGRYDEALELFAQAEELDPSRDESAQILSTVFTAVRRGIEGYDLDRFDAVARPIALADGASPMTTVMAAQMMESLAASAGEPERGLPYLEKAFALVESPAPGIPPSVAQSIRIDGLLRIRHDEAAAVAAKRAAMPEGWTEDASALNSYAWWCFENRVDLEEAERLARRGVELAPAGGEKAAVLDTVAELCNLRGNCRDAVTLTEQAIAEDPDNDYYREQLERFQKILAQRD